MTKIFAKFLILSLSVVFFYAPIHAQTVEPVTVARCVADWISKTYLTDPTKSPVQFSCVYRCADNSGKISEVKAIHLFHKTTDEAEMIGLVCEGARVSHERVDGKLRGDLVAVDGFWAPLSEIPEIKNWALQNKVRLPEKTLEQMKQAMILNLLKVSVAFQQVNNPQFPEFTEAGQILAEIASRSELGKSYLQQSLARIKSKTEQKTKAEHLVDLNISAHGRFLL